MPLLDNLREKTMKEYLCYFLKNIFLVFNYQFEIEESDIQYKYREIVSRALEFNLKENRFVMRFSQYSYTKADLNLELPEAFVEMGRYCLAAFKRQIGQIQKKDADRHAVHKLINSIIETSIIVTLLKYKKNPLKEASKETQGKPYIDKPRLTNVIAGLFSALDKWSHRTYEGRKVPFSILIDYTALECIDHVKTIVDFLEDDASALLTDGLTSYFKASKKLEYNTVKLVNVEDFGSRKQPLVPYRFASFAHACEANSIGIILTVQGDIIVIKEEKILFAKRNGEWHSYDYETFRKNVVDTVKGELTIQNSDRLFREIYLSSLDVAFARTGGCLAVCFPAKIDEVQKCINESDKHLPYRNVDTEIGLKRKILEDIIVDNQHFYLLKRKARQEMLGIDGVTILDSNGNMITSGSIISNEFEANKDFAKIKGGARTRVAMKLSQFGLAIKISADGYIECYRDVRRIY